mmetsp:Transcript_4708/g.11294  ORF Transcript_4708/g.11294 Transcript_4708/m.11294 type:complete len:200 (-) Transcript_4708:557-1156(-)
MFPDTSPAAVVITRKRLKRLSSDRQKIVAPREMRRRMLSNAKKSVDIRYMYHANSFQIMGELKSSLDIAAVVATITKDPTILKVGLSRASSMKFRKGWSAAADSSGASRASAVVRNQDPRELPLPLACFDLRLWISALRSSLKRGTMADFRREPAWRGSYCSSSSTGGSAAIRTCSHVPETTAIKRPTETRVASDVIPM